MIVKTLGVFDVGGTFLKYALSDAAGTLSHQGKVKTPVTKEGFYQVIEELLQQIGPVEGLAFSLPGFIDAKRGYISLGGSLRYHDDCYFVKEMQEHFNLPVSIQNDAKCAALAQCWKGSAKEYENVVVLVFGTGVGGALLQHGELYLGSHFMSLELSCILSGNLATEGIQATLGSRFSIPNLMARMAKRLGMEQLSGEAAFAMLKDKNTVVMEEFQAYYQALAVQLFNFQCAFDPDIFLIGGGISAQPEFVASIQTACDQLISHIPFRLPPIHVASIKYQQDANLIGAVAQFLQG